MPRIFRSLWPLLALLAIAVIGCSKPEDAYVGHYVGKITLSAQTLKALGKNAQAAQAQVDSAKLSLDLKKDKTFSTDASSPMGQSNSNGTWAIANNQVILNATTSTVNGKSVTIPETQRSVKFNVSADKKSLSPDMSAAAAQGSTMVFTKA